jgi:hypothetical protein
MSERAGRSAAAEMEDWLPWPDSEETGKGLALRMGRILDELTEGLRVRVARRRELRDALGECARHPMAADALACLPPLRHAQALVQFLRHEGSAPAAMALIEAGANAAAQDEEGETPLMSAIGAAQVNFITQATVEKIAEKSDFFARDAKGLSALSRAAESRGDKLALLEAIARRCAALEGFEAAARAAGESALLRVCKNSGSIEAMRWVWPFTDPWARWSGGGRWGEIGGDALGNLVANGHSEAAALWLAEALRKEDEGRAKESVSTALEALTAPTLDDGATGLDAESARVGDALAALEWTPEAAAVRWIAHCETMRLDAPRARARVERRALDQEAEAAAARREGAAEPKRGARL